MCTKFLFASVIVLMLFAEGSYCQSDHKQFKLDFPRSLNSINSGTSEEGLTTLALLFPINPIFMLEGKRFYAGITKEFSIGIVNYGRVAAEYSLIFRETKLNQLRFSYNYDFPLEVDIAAILLTFGAGFFTDFYKQGYFPQASFSLLIALDNNIGVNTYVKVRNTFMTESDESDIFDISLGLATIFYF